MSSREQFTANEQVLDESAQVQVTKTEGESAEAAAMESISTEFPIDQRDERIASLEAELATAKQNERDILLRTRADIENMRRRAELDVEKAHKFALEKFTGELLPVIDNLERALSAADKDDISLTPMLEGIELTLKSMLDVVRKFGIIIVEEINVPFNPDIHQAMTLLESQDYEPNHVMMILQKGYVLNGRLLRPAMVVVSKSH